VTVASTGPSVVVEADGGSRGNPGPAGYGAVVFDAATREVLSERAKGIGNTTNNVAEYAGLIAGLQAALALGAVEVEVRMDSKLVIEQMTGRWQVRQPHLQALAREAAGLVDRLGSVRFVWVPRARNTHADRLANEAMDAQAVGSTWTPRSAPVPPAAPPGPPAVAVAEARRGVASWTGATGTPTRLVLLRHAQTEHSVAHRYSGHLDVPLTAEGERQATMAAARIGRLTEVAAVVSSPLSRCVRSASLAAEALGLPVTVHSGLIETDFGRWDGLTFAEAAMADPDLHARWLRNSSVAPPGGESFDAVYERIRRTRDELITKYGGATVVVVSHVTPIKTLLRLALDAGPSLLFRLHLDLASVSVADFYPDGGAGVSLVNDTSHLAR
jgi:ribonuclease H / adenosylcobalamin/alpha-ribazole phosphatase